MTVAIKIRDRHLCIAALFCFITSQSFTVMIKIMTQLVNRALNHESHMFSGLWLMACGIACELGIIPIRNSNKNSRYLEIRISEPNSYYKKKF